MLLPNLQFIFNFFSCYPNNAMFFQTLICKFPAPFEHDMFVVCLQSPLNWNSFLVPFCLVILTFLSITGWWFCRVFLSLKFVWLFFMIRFGLNIFGAPIDYVVFSLVHNIGRHPVAFWLFGDAKFGLFVMVVYHCLFPLTVKKIIYLLVFWAWMNSLFPNNLLPYGFIMHQ